MLKCKNISYSIAGKNILENVNFVLPDTEHLIILGASGCGKTTLLSILAGLQNPDSGCVLYNNTDLHTLKNSQKDIFRGKNIDIVFQNLHLIKVLTVEQNLALAMTLSNTPTDKNRIFDILNRLGLAQNAQQKVSELSFGEAQRVAIARAVINMPKWILCDEPTSALDDGNTQTMLDVLQSEADICGASLIIVTHDKRAKEYFKNHNVLQLKAVK